MALNNFWRSLSNLTINVTTPNFGCYTGEFWAVSQAAPMRRVHVNGQTTLMDYCTGPSFASGGFIADSQFTAARSSTARSSSGWSATAISTAGPTVSGTRSSPGVVGAPAQCFPAATVRGPYTTLATSPVTREAPYLYVDGDGELPRLRALGAARTRPERRGPPDRPRPSIPIDDFYVAQPGRQGETINSALAQGKNVIFTPGIYQLDRTIKVKRAGHGRARARLADARTRPTASCR